MTGGPEEENAGEVARRLGIGPAALALVFNVAPRTASRWYAGKAEAPPPVLAALRAIEAARLAPPSREDAAG